MEVTATEKGAELQSIKGRGGLEYLWQGDAAFWSRRSPLLFPVVGGLEGGSYSHRGSTYKLDNHGFARGRDFRLVSSASDRMRFELASDESSLAVYPFNFVLAVTYRVKDNTLAVAWDVENRGKEPMPFSIGAHPAFRAPLLPDEKREDYDIVFERAERLSRYFLDARNIRSGETGPLLDNADRLTLGASLFERGAVVLADHISRRITLKSRVSGRFVELAFPGFPYLGLWSPADGAAGPCPFVCIEPWFGVMPLPGSSHELSEKEGRIHLLPGRTFSAEYSITVG